MRVKSFVDVPRLGVASGKSYLNFDRAQGRFRTKAGRPDSTNPTIEARLMAARRRPAAATYFRAGRDERLHSPDLIVMAGPISHGQGETVIDRLKEEINRLQDVDVQAHLQLLVRGMESRA